MHLIIYRRGLRSDNRDGGGGVVLHFPDRAGRLLPRRLLLRRPPLDGLSRGTQRMNCRARLRLTVAFANI